MSNQPSPMPGWYPSETAGLERYWDGIQWTAKLRLMPIYDVTGKPQPRIGGFSPETSTRGIIILSIFIPFLILFFTVLGSHRSGADVVLISLMILVSVAGLIYFIWNRNKLINEIKALQQKG